MLFSRVIQAAVVCLFALSAPAGAAFLLKMPAAGLKSAPGVPTPAMASCTLPWGDAVAHGTAYSGAAYSAEVVSLPSTCDAVLVQPTCYDGVLTPSVVYGQCSPSDPLFNSTVLLDHFETAGGPDVKGHPVSSLVGSFGVGSPAKYGAFSGTFNGLTIAAYADQTGSDFTFGAGDFTVEAWVRPATVSGTVYLISSSAWENGDRGGWALRMTNGRMTFGGMSTSHITTTEAIPANTWTHVAVTRTGNTFRLFINGAISSTATASPTYAGTSGSYPRRVNLGGTIMDWSSRYLLTGNIDDARITKASRYTEPFTPPAAAHPDQ